MSFFSPVMAKLGIDIKPFEKGLAKAARSAKASGEEMGKGLGGIKGLIGFGAILGGFKSALSKAQELRDAAAATGGALDPAVQRTADLADNLNKAKEKALGIGVALIGGVQRGVDYAVAGLGKLMGYGSISENIAAIDKGREAAAKAQAEKKKAEDRAKTASDRAAAAAKAEMDQSKEAAQAFNKALEIRESRRYAALSVDQKIEEQLGQIAIAERVVADESADALTRSTAMLSLEEARGKLAEAEAEKTSRQAQADAAFWDKQNKADEARIGALEKQTEELKKQREVVRGTLADYEASVRRSLLPTREEVGSGKRRIGRRARADVRALDKAEKEAVRLADEEQRLREEFNDPNTGPAERRRIMEEGRRARGEREAAIGRAEQLKDRLGSRVSDVSTAKESLNKLKNIDSGIKDLNTKLEAETLTE